MKIFVIFALLLLLISQSDASLKRLSKIRPSKKNLPKHKLFGVFSKMVNYFTGGSSTAAAPSQGTTSTSNTKTTQVVVEHEAGNSKINSGKSKSASPESSSAVNQEDSELYEPTNKRGANACAFEVAALNQDLRDAKNDNEKRAICEDYNLNSPCSGYRNLKGCPN